MFNTIRDSLFSGVNGLPELWKVAVVAATGLIFFLIVWKKANTDRLAKIIVVLFVWTAASFFFLMGSANTFGPLVIVAISGLVLCRITGSNQVYFQRFFSELILMLIWAIGSYFYLNNIEGAIAPLLFVVLAGIMVYFCGHRLRKFGYLLMFIAWGAGSVYYLQTMKGIDISIWALPHVLLAGLTLGNIFGYYPYYQNDAAKDVSKYTIKGILTSIVWFGGGVFFIASGTNGVVLVALAIAGVVFTLIRRAKIVAAHKQAEAESAKIDQKRQAESNAFAASRSHHSAFICPKCGIPVAPHIAWCRRCKYEFNNGSAIRDKDAVPAD